MYGFIEDVYSYLLPMNNKYCILTRVSHVQMPS